MEVHGVGGMNTEWKRAPHRVWYPNLDAAAAKGL